MRDLALLEKGPPAPPADLHPGEDYFASLGDAAFGPRILDLSIGPLAIRLEGLSEDQERALGARYLPFARGGEDPAPDMIVRIGPAGRDGFLRHPAPGERETYRLSSRRAADALALWSYEFAGRIDAAARTARVALVEASGPLFERGLENFLRVLTAVLVLDRGGFLLHASAVVRDGRAYVFFGPSGSGKTTVTDLSPDDVVLSDDMTLVVPRGGRLEAAGIPFGLAHHRPPQHAGSFPIASFNRLVQSPRVRRERIEGAQAVAEILASLPFVLQDTRQGDEAVGVVGGALESAPVYRLEFRKDASFWLAVQEGA
jgi:hypothetical protein